MVSLADAEGQIAAEEARLIGQMAAGDTGAPVAELYRRYGRLLYRFGLQVLGDSGQAEDLVQECFLRLRRDAGRFDADRGTVGGYLFAIARGCAADLGAGDVGRRPPDGGDDAGQIIDSLIVHEALEALSPAHREVLRLAQQDGLTQSQIAERLGLPLGTVKTRMFYAMQALRSALAERGSHALRCAPAAWPSRGRGLGARDPGPA